MPFCSQCGNQVGGVDTFCGRCGARQPVFTPSGAGGLPSADPFASVSPRTASILCYVPWVGWIGAIVVLASERFRGDRVVRFHAFQGLYLFVAWLMNQWVLRWLPLHLPGMGVYGLIQLLLLGMAIFMMVKTSQGVTYSLPLFGELAQRSVSED
jgi:uncharacterized membrane protein